MAQAGKSQKPLLKLPIGIQTFEKIRQGEYIYVDKTQYLLDLIDSGTVYFLSRPRRFGKSLTISTFDALFSGKKELFDGTMGAGRLAAAAFFEREGCRVSPVVRMDMSQTVTDGSVEELKYSILEQVKENQRRYGLEKVFDEKDPGIALKRLLEELNRRVGPVAVLVDEYDKPILDSLEDPAKAERFRAVLRGVYTQIKAEDASVCFVFITGITKFSWTGVFSAMNNLNDISLDAPYASMLGYTEAELKHYFAGYIEQTAQALQVIEGILLDKIRDYYDGFSFDGENRVYNPFSTLNFFSKQEFRNYWFESGSPNFLIQYAKKHDLEAENFRGKVEHIDFTSMTEIELAQPSSFLFQSGYLTLREKRGNRLVLDYPNKEVLSSMSTLFLYGKFQNKNSGSITLDIEDALSSGDVEGLIRAFNQTLAAIPYDIYAREEKKYEEEKANAELSLNNMAESFYHAVLFTLLWASTATTVAENHSYRGRSDVEVLHKGHVYVIELKVADSKKEAEKEAEAALAQIKKKGYADKYAGRNPRLIGLAVDRSIRRLGAWRVE